MIRIQEKRAPLARLSVAASGWVKFFAPLVIGAGILFALDRIQRDTVLTLTQVRPLIVIGAVLMGGIALWGIVRVVPVIVTYRSRFAWRMGFRVVGWLGIVGSILGVSLLLLSNDSDPRSFPLVGAARAVEVIVPLVVGIQAAFLFAPDDEPAMEVMLACPRPISWLLLERLLILAVLQTGVALAGATASIVIVRDADVLLTFVRWIPPTLFFGALGVYVTWRSRQPAFGVAMVGLIWFVFAFMGAVFLPGMPSFWPLQLVQPFLWSIYAYLQPGVLPADDYVLNRILLGALGIVLLVMTARQLRDEEQILLGSRSRKKTGG